jgi:DNA-binding SARP family transcriptional activator
MLQLALLGPPIVERDGSPVSFDTRKAVALLALLATSKSAQSRERLAALFWPESDDSRARSSLRRTLSVALAAAGPALQVTRATVSLDAASVWCDLWEFERLAEHDDVVPLAEAAALYRDDFLAGFSARGGPELDDWQQLVGEEQRQRLSRVLARLIDLRAAAGAFDAALSDARRWLGLDTMHEPAHQALMRLLALSGQRAAAQQQYRRCVRILERELGVAPLPQTNALYEDIRANRLRAAEPDPPRDEEQRRLGWEAPLVAQEVAMGELVDAFGRVGPAGWVATITGPSGSGKTRLTEELHILVAAQGASTGVCHCHDGERGIALGAVTDLLRSAQLASPRLSELLTPSDLAEIARLLPALAPRREPAPAPLESPGAQIRFFDAVGRALATALAPDRPGLVVVEDVQFLDDASAQLLGYLIRRLDALPLLVVLTWQPEFGPPAILRAALADASRAGRRSEVEPRLLGHEQVASLLASSGASGIDADSLLAQTGGLPLLVVAYIETLARSERALPGRSPAVPTGAREMLKARLALASQATLQVLSAAAVLGGSCDGELLRQTSGRGALEVADALDEALARGLLVEVPSGEDAGGASYQFPYEALRQVVDDSCGSARRRLLHSRAASVLARRSERVGSAVTPGTISIHLQHAGRGEEAAEWSWKAAQDSRALYAHAEALAHLRSALALGHPPAETHTAIADTLIVLGRYREALVELEQAAAHGGEDAALALIEHRLAGVHDRLGSWDIASAHLSSALEIGGDDPVLSARIQADRALVAYRLGEDDAARLAELALEKATSCADPRALAQARNVAGVLAGLAGDHRRGEDLLRASLSICRQLSDPGPAVAALNNLARLLADDGRDEEALRAAEEALELGARHGDVHRVGALHSNLADLLHALGRSEESIAHLKSAAATFASVDAGDEARPEIWTLVEW